jgi:hypothetical protein
MQDNGWKIEREEGKVGVRLPNDSVPISLLHDPQIAKSLEKVIR